jgi:2-oxoglutarate dehydrogenase complex dehydrogenase (E1) component-like enzyme
VAYLCLLWTKLTLFWLDDSSQIENRHQNAALLRYVDNVRTHGHRAARIDPLDLIDRESEVAALDPSRYGLNDGQKKYNVNGIIWTNPRVESQRDDTEEWWTLDQITRHLKSVYVGRIAYEVCLNSPLPKFRVSDCLNSICIRPPRQNDSGFLTYLNQRLYPYR